MLNVREIAPSFDLKLDCDGPVFSEDLESLVEALWQAEQTRRGKAMHDGRIMSAVRVSATGIHGCTVGYRHLIAQRARPELFSQLCVRPVAVSGLLHCRGGIVFGHRANSMTQDAGLWELVPSGGIDTNNSGTTVDYIAQIRAELSEETGITATDITTIRPFCLVEDTESHVLDIGISLESSLEAAQVLQIHRETASREYDELCVVPQAQIDRFMADGASRLVGVSMALLRQSNQLS